MFQKCLEEKKTHSFGVEKTFTFALYYEMNDPWTNVDGVREAVGCRDAPHSLMCRRPVKGVLLNDIWIGNNNKQNIKVQSVTTSCRVSDPDSVGSGAFACFGSGSGSGFQISSDPDSDPGTKKECRKGL